MLLWVGCKHPVKGKPLEETIQGYFNYDRCCFLGNVQVISGAYLPAWTPDFPIIVVVVRKLFWSLENLAASDETVAALASTKERSDPDTMLPAGVSPGGWGCFNRASQSRRTEDNHLSNQLMWPGTNSAELSAELRSRSAQSSSGLIHCVHCPKNTNPSLKNKRAQKQQQQQERCWRLWKHSTWLVVLIVEGFQQFQLWFVIDSFQISGWVMLE